MVQNTNLNDKKITKWFRCRRRKLGHSRQLFTDEVKAYLLTQFEKNIFPNRKELEQMASVTELGLKYVKDWFKFRRIKMNKSDTNTTNN